MATLASAVLLSNNSSDANFRAWSKFISDVFALGWVDTAAAGQINFATVTAPVAINTSQGFKVYRMDDALQATKPVFIKLEFGSGAAAITPGIWVTIGTTHDGAGTIGGTILLARLQLSSTANSAVVQADSYGSAANNRVCFGLFLNNANIPFWFSLERSKDSTGADTGDALLLNYGWSTVKAVSATLMFVGVQPPQQTFGLHFISCQENNSIFATDVGVSPVFNMAGVAKQPGMNLMVARSGDFGNFSNPSIPIYGTNHTYVHLGALISTFRNGFNTLCDTGCRLMMRYE